MTWLARVVVFFLTALVSNCTAPQRANDASSVEYALSLGSGEQKSNSDFEGSPVVLDFWASWCSPCVAAFPHFQSVFDTYRAKGVHFFAVNHGESLDIARHFLESNGYSIPLAMDTHLELSAQFKVSGIPTTYLLDKRGNIRFVHRGFLPDPGIEAVLGRELDVLLAE